MADLVGLPLAHATRLFLRGKLKGVTLPVPFEPGITTPMLDALAGEGVCFEERYCSPHEAASFHHLSS